MAPAMPMTAVRTGNRSVRLLPVVRWGLVFVYAWSGGGKLFWPQQFRELLVNTGMLPIQLIPPLVHGLPILELLLALALAAKLLLPAVLLLSTFLATVFTALHAYLALSGTLVRCGLAVAIDFSSWESHVFLLCVSLAMGLGSVALLFGTAGSRS